MGKVRTLAPPRGGCNLSPLLCGSGFRVESSRNLDLKQRRQLGRGRHRELRIRNLDVDQLLERGIPPILGKIPRLDPCPVRNWSHRFCIMS